MQVIYYHSPDGNFGDDLNAVLWRELLPAACFETDDAVLLGIGSIFRDDFLSPAATHRKRVFVLGSGAGTGPLPSRWPNADWSILAVRGPLTARLIGVPQAAATDAAALIASTPALTPPPIERNEIAFIPHYNSVGQSRWQDICDKVGFSFIDAHWPVRMVVTRLARAQLVIAEAMHGAIVADALRIPWVPVVCSPAVLPFKWIDWAHSLGLDYQPIALPPSSAWEALRHLKIRAFDIRRTAASQRDEDILADFRYRFGAVATDDLVRKPIIAGTMAKRAQQIASMFDGFFRERAAHALIAASKARPLLSHERIFNERLGRLQDAVGELQRALAA